VEVNPFPKEECPVHKYMYRFAFTTPADMAEIEKTLLMAVLAVSCLHGPAAVRLDAGYAVDHDRRLLLVDASTPVGRDVTRVFAGLCVHEYGDTSFRVEAVLPLDPAQSGAA
jgi:hypothetical protein